MNQADSTSTGRARSMERDARALSDDALESELAEAERAVVSLRSGLHDALARRDALEAEKDHRSVQRHAGSR